MCSTKKAAVATVKKSYTSGDVAKICEVTPRTIIRWISSGKLSAFKLPGRGNNRVTEEALLSFLHANAMPIPKNLLTVQERHCVIVAHDKHFVRHVKRIVRNADYITHVISDPLEAGLSIAVKQPSLVVLDVHALPALPEHAELTAIKIKLAVTAHSNIILFTDNETVCQTTHSQSGISRLKKPLNLNQFANHIEQLQAAMS